MFLSGFLLFLVEPMVAKMVLPILGGVPMVWNGCVVFFQIVMLAGYGYAFGASRWLQLRHHVVRACRGACGAGRASALHDPGGIGDGAGWQPDRMAAAAARRQHRAAVLRAVDERVGAAALAVTDRPPSARDPYFLYSASNLGCLLALACYPTVVEPLFTLREQTRLWTIGYAEFVLLAGACARLCVAADTASGSVARRGSGRVRGTGRCAGHAVAPRPLGGARVRSVQPDARGDELHIDGHRGGAAAVDRAARVVPPDLRPRVRPALGGGRGGHEAGAAAARGCRSRW